MNRIVLAFLLMLFQASAFAQLNYNTEYYKLTKVYTNGVGKEQSGNSGQFITRVKSSCYDSDNKGNSVNNGALTLIDQKSNISKYNGNCYYGNDCYYTFFDDKGILNIETRDGKVYVYRKATPPSGRTTCSLIKSNSSNGSSVGGGGYVAPSQNNGSQNNNQTTRKKTKHTCTVCGGKGRKIKEYYSGGQFKYCAECGREVNGGHQHVMCDNCKGTGYIEY